MPEFHPPSDWPKELRESIAHRLGVALTFCTLDPLPDISLSREEAKAIVAALRFSIASEEQP